ncbi:MAG TPA: FAD-dependent oxidoreductase, partial [Anaeromyxobacteraceae bacterium]|nr:FAD-dependent oxidoreductase [Anaeromyxobacteraceae bacterium]
MRADAIIIGAGQAGVPLAVRLARSGRKVLLVERALLGGTCINYGCTPTKTLVASARAAHVARSASRLGVHASAVRVDFPAIIARKDALVHQWRQGIAQRLAAAGDGLRVVSGHARFVGERQIEVDGDVHHSELIVVNVGARPAAPPIDGIGSVAWLDNRRIMELPRLPTHLVVLGGGYIGCEFAQMFRRFGSDVTIVQHGPHLLDREDPEVSEELEKAFRAEGIELHLGARAAQVSQEPGGRIVVALESGATITASHLLAAVGRRPNTDDLGCEASRIQLNANGFIEVDDRYRTSAPGVHAVGDVTGGPQFTHTSWDDHRILFDILQGHSTRGRAGRVIPYSVFTDP